MRTPSRLDPLRLAAALGAVPLFALWLCSCPKIDDPVFADWDVKPRMVCEGERVKFEYFISPNAKGKLDALRITPEVGEVDLAQNEKVHEPKLTQTYTIEAKVKGSWHSTPQIPTYTVTVVTDCDPVEDPANCKIESAKTPGKSTGQKGPNEPPCEWIVEYPPGSVSKKLRVATLHNPNTFDLFVRKVTQGKLWSPVPAGGTWQLMTPTDDDSVPLEGVWRIGPAHGEDDPRFKQALQQKSLKNCIGLPIEVRFTLTCGSGSTP